MNKRGHFKKRIVKTVFSVILAVVLVLSTPLGVSRHVEAATTNSHTRPVYYWRKVVNLEKYEVGKKYRLLMLYNDGDYQMVTTGSNWKKEKIYMWTEKDTTNYYFSKTFAGDYEKNSYVQSMLSKGYTLISDFNGTESDFYSLSDYDSWYIKRERKGCQLYMANNEQLSTNDDWEGCLKTGSNFEESGNQCWSMVNNGKKVNFYYDVAHDHWFEANNYMGTNSGRIFCESLCSSPSGFYGDKCSFTLYIGETQSWSEMDGYDVTSGVLNIDDRLLLTEDTTLTIFPGAVVSVTGHLWCNGTIKNYGTLIVRDGGCISSFNPQGTTACVIENYGADTDNDITRRAGISAEGNLIIMRDGMVAMNNLSGPIVFKNGAQLVNYGKMILPCGYSIADSTFRNYGTVGIGWYYLPNGHDPMDDTLQLGGSASAPTVKPTSKNYKVMDSGVVVDIDAQKSGNNQHALTIFENKGKIGSYDGKIHYDSNGNSFLTNPASQNIYWFGN